MKSVKEINRRKIASMNLQMSIKIFLLLDAEKHTERVRRQRRKDEISKEQN